MRKTYVIVAASALLVILAAAGGGFGFWKYKQNQKKSVVSTGTNQSDGSTLGLSSENANSDVSSLSQQQQNAASTEAANNQGNSLQTNLGQQSSAGSTGSSKTSSNTVDPTSFGKYDQYKDKTTASYAVLSTGNGDVATAGKKAVVVYKGWLTNGTLFDESKKDPKTGKYISYSFVISDGSTPSSVIAGWQEGINGMKVGEERLLIIPPAVGYGSTDHPPIPANSVLVFDVLLVAVQ